MTDIFISYSRHDQEMVTVLARILEESGYSVWWDVDGLYGGRSFAKVIQEKLTEAKCAIVVWSPDSVTSNWVHSEATLADKRGILVTAVYREADAPMPFNNRHNENLRGWNGNVFDDGFQRLIAAVQQLCPKPNGTTRSPGVAGSVDQLYQNKQPEAPKNEINKKTKILGLGVLAVAIASGAYLLIPTKQDSQNSAQSIAVTPQVASQTSKAKLAEEKRIAGQKRLADEVEAVRIAETKRLADKKRLEDEAARIAEEKRLAEEVETVRTAEHLAEKKRLADETKAASSKVYKLANNLTLLPIPAGNFMMGSESGADDEKPAHKVTFDKPFWMSKTEITFDQYDAYAKAAGKRLPDDREWGRRTRPVINVSWNDSQGYVKWLSDNNAQGLQCRLPSEAEWEYAARASSTTKYSWGNEIGNNKANCDGCGSQWDNKKTAPVGSFPENLWGLNDMHGNVWEWVQDPFHKDYAGAPDSGIVWGKEGESSRALRGGSWAFTPYSLRSASRYFFAPDIKYRLLGFRIVCSPPSVH